MKRRRLDAERNRNALTSAKNRESQRRKSQRLEGATVKTRDAVTQQRQARGD